VSSPEDDPEFEDLLLYLKDSRGFDFSGYKRSTLMRRMAKRMQAVRVTSFSAYLDYLQVHQDEFASLFDVILINVTSFFRDPPIWEYLGETVIPRLLEGRHRDEQVRAWCAGVASGEEAYSLAMLLAEAMGREEFLGRVKIYATDADEAAVQQARQASYSEKDVEDVPAPLLERYFDQANSTFVFDKDLRHSVIFGRHDLVQDAPISRIDLLLCRNTLMYFNTDTQAKVLSHLRFALNPGGYLVLGKAEMLFSGERAFEPVDLRRRVFVKLGSAEAGKDWEHLVATSVQEPPVVADDRIRGRDAALEAGPVAQVVVDEAGVLTSANRRARDLFGLSTADLGRPFHELDVSYRPVELRSLMEQSRTEGRVVALRAVPWSRAPGETVFLDVEVMALHDAAQKPIGVSVTFADVTRDNELRRELELANQELETAMEELQSTNEELETTNEELQSTNEELETMNEELQSTNEELSAVNEEMRQRRIQLDEVNAFLESIMSSVDRAVVVLDQQLHVLVWNPGAEDLWGLRPQEAQRQPFLNLDIGLPVADLKPALRAALENADGTADLEFEATNRRGQPIRCRVNVSPLQGPDGTGRGVILLMDALAESGERPA